MAFFSKGIKLPKSKDSLSLLEIPLPKRVILPLKQYIGDLANPAVKVGDKVKAGQLIATSDTENSLPLYATISGEISDISERFEQSNGARRVLKCQFKRIFREEYSNIEVRR